MPSPPVDIDRVARLVQDVARDIVLPRFGALRAGDVQAKPSSGDLEDLVTIVDTEAEERLSEGLREVVPDAPVLGEESCHREPALLALVHGDRPLWIVDPLDGTRNFAAGRDDFGIMVSFAVAGKVRAAWVHIPMRGETYAAEAGSGTWLNGDRLRVPEAAPAAAARGSLFVRFMPPDLRDAVVQRSAGQFRDVTESKCAAIEYTDVLRARKEFLIYYRLLPWDHGAPALLLSEAGGRVEHVNGQPYTVRSDEQVTIVAQNDAVAAEVRAWLTRPGPLPGRSPRQAV